MNNFWFPLPEIPEMQCVIYGKVDEGSFVDEEENLDDCFPRFVFQVDVNTRAPKSNIAQDKENAK